MRRYWRIYKTFFLSSFARELEFRANFFAKILQQAAWVGFFILVILVIYSNTNSVAGWSQKDAIALNGASMLISAAFDSLFLSTSEIPQLVRLGTLDYIVSKPVDSQFWVSMRKFNFNQIGMFLFGATMVGIGAANAGSGLEDWLAFVVLELCAVMIYYSFVLTLMTLGIWFVRVDNLWALGETVLWSSRYPLEIYTLNLRRLFMFVLPMAFLGYAPAKQLVHGADWGMVGLGALWMVVFVVGSRSLWRYAMRDYTSASS